MERCGYQDDTMSTRLFFSLNSSHNHNNSSSKNGLNMTGNSLRGVHSSNMSNMSNRSNRSDMSVSSAGGGESGGIEDMIEGLTLNYQVEWPLTLVLHPQVTLITPLITLITLQNSH